MRTKSPIDALFPATRRAILGAVTLRADRWWYLSDLARHLGVSPSSLQRELARLTEAGILRRRQDGNRAYFQADADCPFLPELQGLLTKTAGLADVLREALASFAERIMWAFVFGSVARGEAMSPSDVDLMVVGEVGLSDLSVPLRKAQDRLGREINAVVYNRAEFAKKLKAGHHFLCAVLKKEKIFILGDERELEKAAGRKTRGRRTAHQARA